jgi:catalase (peroxidase I)
MFGGGPYNLSQFGGSAVSTRSSRRSMSMSNQLWWPNRLDLSILHQNSPAAIPWAKGFNYAEEFKSLDLKA